MGFRYRSPRAVLLWLFLLFLFKILARFSYANDTLTQSQQLKVRQTITSPGDIFELGFFIPANSSKQYLGIWYKNTHVRKVIWVANREDPLPATDSDSSLVIGKDGNLRLLDGESNLVWRTNASFQSNISVAVLADDGDFTLQDNTTGFVLWESFNYPCDTLLPGMNLGQSTKTGDRRFLSSWKTNDDPLPGEFVAGLTSDIPPQVFVWNGSKPYWRGGPWDGGKFLGIPDSDEGYASNFKLLPNNYLTLVQHNATVALFMALTPAGSLQIMQQDDVMEDMYIKWLAPGNPCDVYGVCGPFGVCNKNRSSICECLKGFKPKFTDDWRKGNWSGGCVRHSELWCERNLSSNASVKAKSDGFWKLSGVKLPDQYNCFRMPDSESCQKWCMNNCACIACAFLPRIGCMVWGGSLLDIQDFSYNGNDLFLRLAHSELDMDDRKEKIIISVATISLVVLLAALVYGLHRCGATKRALTWRRNRMKGPLAADIMVTSTDTSLENVWADHRVHEGSSELPLIELEKVLVATDNFNRANKLGEGGFGEVYKGKLDNGQEVAVKRLSSHSGQGDHEFKTEIILISKLQHRNLVRLLGCCTEGKEKLLVYEYMKNKSLDTFLFDANNRRKLDWAKRFKIIHGTARGLLYLHRDSRLRVIHRDLKASNILLDDNLDAKISDFGLARIFEGTQDLANTRRVVGTFGYMSPEYAIGGLFSEKSDVFSFGVLLLEIVSGMKNTSFFNQEKYIHLLGHAWELWEEKKEMDLLDQALADSYTPQDVKRCVQIGLLCVQDKAADRPTMSTVVVMLSSEIELPQPKKPTFTFQSLRDSDLRSQPINTYSKNELSMSTLVGR